MGKICVLDETRLCTECNSCDVCDLDSNKKCNNCMECLNISRYDYKEIQIEGIIDAEEYDDYVYEEEILESKNDIDLSDSIYLDDIDRGIE